MNGSTLPLIDLSLEATDPVLAHLVRFAHDVAWRHRRNAADPARFRSMLEAYHRAWRISDGTAGDLDARTLRIVVAAYRSAHRALHHAPPGRAAA